jgi:hypothetical protein
LARISVSEIKTAIPTRLAFSTCNAHHKMKSLEIKTVSLAISFLVTAGAAQTTTALPTATAPALLRPSSGEIIRINQIYTVEWTPPPPGPLAIEVSGNRNGHVGQIHSLLPDTWTCTGYIINTECRKLNITIPEGATSYGIIPIFLCLNSY